MAVICPSHSLLYLLNPRTGGSAVAEHLIRKFQGEWIPESDILAEDGTIELQKKHQTLRDLVAYGVLSEQEIDDLAVFTNVRNPFDSLVSLYEKYRGRYARWKEQGVHWIWHSGPRILEEIEYCRNHSFDQWVLTRYWKAALLSLTRRRDYSVNADYLYGCRAVLRQEYLPADFAAFLNALGMVGEANVPVRNETAGRERRSYREYYSPLSRVLVATTYRQDLVRHGYSF